MAEDKPSFEASNLFGEGAPTFTFGAKEDDAEDVQAEVVSGDWKVRAVTVTEVAVSTGEEGETVIWEDRARLYRFALDAEGAARAAAQARAGAASAGTDAAAAEAARREREAADAANATKGEWKERGTGQARLLRGPDGRCRLVLRQEKTSKVACNFYVLKESGRCELEPNMGNDKIWQWHALDCSDPEKPKAELLALRLKTPEVAKVFKGHWDECAEDTCKAVEAATKTDKDTAKDVSKDTPEETSEDGKKDE